MRSEAIIIVAGGKGTRMGTAIPKQYLLLHGKPILMHTIERFHLYNPQMQIVLVLSDTDYWQTLCATHQFTIPHLTAPGGETRFHSVRNGLAAVDQHAELIGVHDAVRPFVSVDVIRQCYHTAATTGAAIPVTDVVETLRHVHPDGMSETVPRSDYRLVQTPQVFAAPLLRRAYRQAYSSQFTDDASVVETLGHPVTLVPDNRENIKITTPSDLPH